MKLATGPKFIILVALPVLAFLSMSNHATAEFAPSDAPWRTVCASVNAGAAFGGSDVPIEPAGGNVNAFKALQQFAAVPTSLSPDEGSFVAGFLLGASFQVSTMRLLATAHISLEQSHSVMAVRLLVPAEPS